MDGDKSKPKKEPKKRASTYDAKLSVSGTFSEVLRVMIQEPSEEFKKNKKEGKA